MILLRGVNELVTPSHRLRAECVRKYGPDHGATVYGILIEVFAKLPIAAVVDETIACLHSGIPSTGAARLDQRLYKVPTLLSLERDAPVAHQVSVERGEEAISTSP